MGLLFRNLARVRRLSLELRTRSGIFRELRVVVVNESDSVLVSRGLWVFWLRGSGAVSRFCCFGVLRCAELLSVSVSFQ